jgi:hypothetical protein
VTAVHRLAVLDNTVLTNFAIVGRDNLPLLLWPGACTTPAALGEYRAGVATGALPNPRARPFKEYAAETPTSSRGGSDGRQRNRKGDAP